MKRCVKCNKILTPWNSNNGGFSVERKNGVTKEGKYCNDCSNSVLSEIFFD